MKRKILHSGGETIEYTYNIRNWTKSITSNRFSQTLYYQDALDGKPVYYNGNISAIKWGTGATQEKKYHFSYDDLNRMTYAAYSPDNIFDEKVDQYDKNGNIISLKRNGWANDSGSEEYFSGYIDYLTMIYNGNQLVNADDMVEEIFNQSPNDFYNVWDENIETEYYYDDNGNQYADLNKGIAWIKYNLLNLPEKIQFQNGNKIEYLYDASGVKRQAKWAYSSTTVFIPLNGTDQENNSLHSIRTTQYCGNYIYEQGQIKRILTPEGYITTNNLPMQFMYMWRYNYSLKDYQGNTRQTLYGNTLSGNQTVLYASSSSTVDYYPFGMEMTTPEGNYTSGTNPYLYNGKEIDRMHGLNQYDYGARWRDGALPAWTTVDPLAELKPWQSPYIYCSNNPANRIDPTGLIDKDTTGRTEHRLIPEITVTAPRINNNSNNYNSFQLLYNNISDHFENLFSINIDVSSEAKKAETVLKQNEKNKTIQSYTKAANLISTYIVVGATLIVVSGGVAYIVESGAGAIMLRIISNEALKAAIATGKVVTTTMSTAQFSANWGWHLLNSNFGAMVAGGFIEGILKSSVKVTPPDLYMLPSPVSNSFSDATQGAIYFISKP